MSKEKETYSKAEVEKLVAEAVLKTNKTVYGVDIDEHRRSLAKLRAELDSKRDILDACLIPEIAAEYEMKKTRHFWNVTAQLRPRGDLNDTSRRLAEDGYGYEEVRSAGQPARKTVTRKKIVAETEDEAWARFCDKTDCMDSRFIARPVFERGERVPPEKYAAMCK